MNLADIMLTEVLWVTPETKLREAAHALVDGDRGAACVWNAETEELVGIISERDLLRAFALGTAHDSAVADSMTRHVLTAAPEKTIPEALAIMIDGRFRHLPVIDKGRVVGIVSIRDLLAWSQWRVGHAAESEDELDPAELLATIHRMRTGAG
jgi:CBS domain-containing protein